MKRARAWNGGMQLAGRTIRSAIKVGMDAVRERATSALPSVPEQLATPEFVNALLRDHAPSGTRSLPDVTQVRLPHIHFESSNCTNFLVELDYVEGDGHSSLPKTAYVKMPCPEWATRIFANSLGFWELEYFFCKYVSSEIPIRTPRVYAAAWRGSRFVLLLENLHEIPDVKLFLNRDMAAGTTPETAARILRGFAKMHSKFWGWSEGERESLLPASLDTYRAAHSRDVTRALNASALAPAMRLAPDILSASVGETYRRALKNWDVLLDAWYSGPLTLVHGDSHLGNCFEYPHEDELRTGMFDFQAVHWSKGMRDVQYFMINSLEPDTLIAHERDLIAVYCDELSRCGIDLDQGDAFMQYRAFSFQTLLVGVVPLGLGNLTERDSTVLAVTRRSAAAVERLGFREWMDDLL